MLESIGPNKFVDSETGRQFTLVEEQPPDCLARDQASIGVRVNDMVLFPDGSWKELCGAVHKPPPLGGEYPRKRPMLILRFWEAVHEQKSNEFDKLKRTLERRGENFTIHFDGQDPVDALTRLKQLKGEVETAIGEYKKAEIALEEARPQRLRDMERLTREQAEKQAEFVSEVRGIEVGGSIEKPERSSTR
jgi:hypothetical protein